MKTFIFSLLFICIQVKAFPSISELQGKVWDDAIQKLGELEEKVDDQYGDAYQLVLEAEMDFYLKEEKVIASALHSINETTVINLKQLDEWIKKAQEKKVDPTKCTGDRKTIEEDLPLAIQSNFTSAWTNNEAWNDLNIALRNLTIIPNRIHDLYNKLYDCTEDDESCIRNVVVEIDNGFKTIPNDIEKYKNAVENTLSNVLIGILETYIKENLEILRAKDEQLTNKGVQCIKDLFNK